MAHVDAFTDEGVTVKETTMVRTAPRAPGAIDDLWAAYERTGAAECRNRLVERYLPLVRRQAERVHQRLPHPLELEELVSAGTCGLIRAIESYDARRGVRFETYAQPRVRGAILDELRTADWMPRQARTRSTALDRAAGSLQRETGRTPTREELGERLGISTDAVDRMQRDAETRSPVSLTANFFEGDPGRPAQGSARLEDSREPDPIESAERGDLKALLTKRLTRAERLVLILHYYERMTLKEIARAIHFSPSRVSQLHRSILGRLRVQLENRSHELS